MKETGGGIVALVEPIRFAQAYLHSMHNTNPRGKTVVFLSGVRVVIILAPFIGFDTIWRNYLRG